MRLAVIIVLLVMNLVAFAAYGIDKKKAENGKWRTKESTLLTLAALFGAAGAYAGMKVFHHKTQKPPFTWFVPFMLVLQVAVLIALVVFGVL